MNEACHCHMTSIYCKGGVGVGGLSEMDGCPGGGNRSRESLTEQARPTQNVPLARGFHFYTRFRLTFVQMGPFWSTDQPNTHFIMMQLWIQLGDLHGPPMNWAGQKNTDMTFTVGHAPNKSWVVYRSEQMGFLECFDKPQFRAWLGYFKTC